MRIRDIYDFKMVILKLKRNGNSSGDFFLF